MDTDRRIPKLFAAVPIERMDRSSLSPTDYNVAVFTVDIHGRQDRRPLEIVVKQVVWLHLIEPLEFAGVVIQGD